MMEMKGIHHQQRRITRLSARTAVLAFLLSTRLSTVVAQEPWQHSHDAGLKAAAESRFADAEALLMQSIREARKAAEASLMEARSDVDLGEVYRAEHKYDLALPCYDEALKVLAKLNKSDAIEAAEALDRQGEVYIAVTDYPHAEPVLVQALKIRREKAPSDEALMAQVEADLAGVYAATNKDAEAAALFKDALANRQKLNASAGRKDDEDEQAARLFYDLGNLAKKAQRWPEAEQDFRKAVSAYGKVLGGDHPDYANAMEGLAMSYSAREQYDLAEPLLVRVLEIRQKTLGEDHHDVAVALDSLALVAMHQRRSQLAVDYYQRALKIWEKIFGPESPGLSADLGNLAVAYQIGGRFAEAESPLRRAVTNDQKGLPPDSPDLASDLQNLAMLYANSKRLGEAIPLFKSALAIRVKALGESDPDTLDTLKYLVSTLRRLNRDQEAAAIEQQFTAGGKP